MVTALGVNLQKDYKDRGFMPNFFLWLEGLKVPLESVENMDICQNTRVVGVDENKWIIREPCDPIEITVHLHDGTEKHKAFTKQELHDARVEQTHDQSYYHRT